jgi:hypothetical protein
MIRYRDPKHGAIHKIILSGLTYKAQRLLYI